MGAFCSRIDSNELFEDEGRFVIRFIGCTDVPRADITSESDPYIVAYLEDNNQRSRPFRSSMKMDNPNPIWNAYHDFRISYRVTATLVIEIWDSDLVGKDDLVGQAKIPLSKLKDEEIQTVALTHMVGSATANPNFKVSLQRVFVNVPPPTRKVIYLLRHAESKWNEAQETKNVADMIDMDHPLSFVGIQQAVQFNGVWKRAQAEALAAAAAAGTPTTPKPSTPKPATPQAMDRRLSSQQQNGTTTKRVTFSLPQDEILNNTEGAQPSTATATASSAARQQSPSAISPASNRSIELQHMPSLFKPVNYEDNFLQCDKIYVSPLTRAIQTALLTLKDHPTMVKDGIVLYSPIREAKRSVGGIDCCGVACGDDIKKRVHAELLASIQDPRGSAKHSKKQQERNEEVSPPLPVNVEAACVPAFDINDCNMPWWTGKMHAESKNDVDHRIVEFIKFIQYNNSSSCIFVGHSLFFKEFCNHFVGPALKRKHPELGEDMINHKMLNCTMLGMTIIFPQLQGNVPSAADVGSGKLDLQAYAYIDDATVLFGHGGFDKRGMSGSQLNSGSPSPSGSSPNPSPNPPSPGPPASTSSGTPANGHTKAQNRA